MIKNTSIQSQKKAPPLNWFAVRGHFVARGESAARWARRHGYIPAYVHLSATGLRAGPKARRIVSQLKAELGL
jgi:hypothetical protein